MSRAAALLLFAAAAAAQVDPGTSAVVCQSTTVTAGTTVNCTVILRDSGGSKTGNEGELCNIAANLTDANGDCVAMPFYYSGQIGDFVATITPTVAGYVTGVVTYLGTAVSTPVVSVIELLTIAAAEDRSKATSKCNYDTATGNTECEVTHRDRWSNVVQTCLTVFLAGGGQDGQCVTPSQITLD
eukprot:TRINITY_DN17637_c0_g1_i2.p1 TRINITY_DN17637_c0_g1~~TRINITY_DN17637_c0_g1_i2.p1  ORF type:complete len:201 (+),score=61.10 TRINITY_DN17637_c0_g1_i2:50-604(+)